MARVIHYSAGTCAHVFLKEKIVTGMFMRSTDFADLRVNLVKYIEENRDSIALKLQMETLDSLEYRAD